MLSPHLRKSRFRFGSTPPVPEERPSGRPAGRTVAGLGAMPEGQRGDVGRVACDVWARRAVVFGRPPFSLKGSFHPNPDTPCMPYMPTLGWFGGLM